MTNWDNDFESTEDNLYLINNDSYGQPGARRQQKERHVTPFLCLSIFGAVIGCALPMGYNNGVMNTPQEYIKDFINDSKESRYGEPFSTNDLYWFWSFTVSSYCLGGVAGSFFGSWAANKFGRKTSMIYLNVLVIIGALMMSFSKNCNHFELLSIGRVVIGFNNGAAVVICPMYLSEIAPKQIRGGIGIIFQLSVIIGAILSLLLGCNFLFGNEKLWPQLFNMLLVFAAIQCFILPFCPESPRFLLVERGDDVGCSDVLSKLRDSKTDTREEMREIVEEDLKQKSEPERSLKDFFTIPSLRRPLFVAIAMALSQQLSGINSMSTFTEPLFDAALPSDIVAKIPDLKNYLIVGMFVISGVATAAAVPLVDRIGRKTMHLTGLVGMAVCTLVLSILFSDLKIEDDQQCHGFDIPQWGTYVSVAFFYIYMVFFAIGPGCVPWLITPELFTVGTVSKAVSVACVANWLANFSVQFGFQPIQLLLCGWVFLVFFVFLIFFIIYLYIKLPETKGMTITQIVELFE